MSALAAYCINLEKRKDRWQECQQNYFERGLSESSVQKWLAIEDPDFGALGCARSHVAVLSEYLANRSEPYCLVMEDDFDFLQSWNEFTSTFNRLQNQRLDWDVLLLAGTCTIAYADGVIGIARVIESQSASGYLIQRRYVPEILHCFANSVVMLEKFRHHQPRDAWTLRFAIDQSWKALQRRDRWFINQPAVGHQRPSFSDIEKKHVDYSDLSWSSKTN